MHVSSSLIIGLESPDVLMRTHIHVQLINRKMYICACDVTLWQRQSITRRVKMNSVLIYLILYRNGYSAT